MSAPAWRLRWRHYLLEKLFLLESRHDSSERLGRVLGLLFFGREGKELAVLRAG